MANLHLRTAFGLALVGTTLACQPSYGGLEIRYLNGTGEFSDAGLVITEGQALAVRVEPISRARYEDYEKFDLVTMRAADPTVLVVSPSTDVDQFVFLGVGVGRTSIDIEINGDDVDTISAEVRAQTGGGR